MSHLAQYCISCAKKLVWIKKQEDSGEVNRLRCPACGWTYWNNPTPVLAAIVDVGGKILLARNALWKDEFYGLITGFMEKGESPQEGVKREVKEETNLEVERLEIVDCYDAQPMNQVIIAYYVKASGDICLSDELLSYKLVAPQKLYCWTSATGKALQSWLRSQGLEPEVFERQRKVRVLPTVDQKLINNSENTIRSK